MKRVRSRNLIKSFINAFVYTQTTVIPVATSLFKGGRGSAVTQLQKHLYDLGFAIKINGWLGNQTETMIKEYQTNNAMTVTEIADAVTVVKKPNRHDAVRKKIVAVAERTLEEKIKTAAVDAVNTASFAHPTEDIAKLTSDSDQKSKNAVLDEYNKIELVWRELEENSILIGYYGYNSFTNIFSSFNSFFCCLLGLSISIVTLSFGAPFWFEVLTKAINARRSGTKPS